MADARELVCPCGCKTFTLGAINPTERSDKPQSDMLGKADALVAECTKCKAQVTMSGGFQYAPAR